MIQTPAPKGSSQMAVKGVERLFFPVPIEIIKLGLVAVIYEPGPAVRFSAPGAHNLRLVAIIEKPAATGTSIHRTILSFVLRRMSGSELGLERRKHRWSSMVDSALPGTEHGIVAMTPNRAP